MENLAGDGAVGVGSVTRVMGNATRLLRAVASCYSSSSVRRAQWIAVVAVTAGLGCERPDIGNECPLLEATPPTGGGTRIETDEIVGQDVKFDCDELICVATDGRAGYCSAKCREDAGCPAGFECRHVQPKGEFADDMFCVWKRCDRPRDCGSKDDFRCCHPRGWPCGGESEGLTLATGEQIKLCTFRE